MDTTTALSALQAAGTEEKISTAAVANARKWLTEPRYAEYAPRVAEHIAEGKWKELDDVFWTVIPFGTGGRRGRMYPIGCNAINERTIGESAQGLAEYVLAVRGQGSGFGEGGQVQSSTFKVQSSANGGLETGAACSAEQASSSNPEPRTLDPKPSCALAYDTRHNSRLFAELCASIMVANGFRVYFLDDYRSTPELSFLVRYKHCDCGIMVTASHNPPSDNAVKVYWSTGGQVVPPHDKAIVERVMNVTEIKRVDFSQAVVEGAIVLCKDEIDRAFIEQVLTQRSPGPRNLKILYSPLHGVGEFAAAPALWADGFRDIEIYPPQRQPNGDFPNVPGHVSNPENPEIFDMLISRAMASGAELILATDPDCDRMGCAAPISTKRKNFWGRFTGNQLAALLTDFVCASRKKAGTLSSEQFLVTTLVTTPLVRRIGTSYGVRTLDNVHVGFKWIAQQIDAAGADKFLFGTEESHGFLIGQYVRDKDGAAACMLMAELAAEVKAAGKTPFDRLESLYWQHGYHGDRQVNIFMTGSAGMARMQALMRKFRTAPPATLAGIAVRQIRDYLCLTTTPLGGSPTALDAPKGDMIILDLAEEGHYVAVRPSGTEPKVKFYLFTFVAPEQLHLLNETREQMDQRLNQIEADLRSYVDAAC